MFDQGLISQYCRRSVKIVEPRAHAAVNTFEAISRWFSA